MKNDAAWPGEPERLKFDSLGQRPGCSTHLFRLSRLWAEQLPLATSQALIRGLVKILAGSENVVVRPIGPGIIVAPSVRAGSPENHDTQSPGRGERSPLPPLTGLGIEGDVTISPPSRTGLPYVGPDGAWRISVPASHSCTPAIIIEESIQRCVEQRGQRPSI